MLNAGEATAPPGLAWTPEAEARVARIPEFIRPMARKAIERLADARGLTTVTEAVMDEARGAFGM
ncbi:MAG: PCP reductase family protein [Candidatus Rokubacteria bacterium]|nr:PCP reductase family protein [Candidatus Rokubacteria bacterium]MBI3827472.1 PCP reductase family protein [Candidatus Rokubacteria bacterium]